ncbi:hypothetical protein DL768_002413 [Monosporascus sp. mg162]|nr:hypothetical protein DL768_002413 [Monosporascus sp. mg162]
MPSKSEFPVHGRTVVLAGGSRGLGLAIGRQLAEKGANIQGASNPETQRFHQISADLTSPSEAIRVVDEVVSWNSGSPPDIVWCCAGTSHPTLFIDTPVSEFQAQMNSNYFTSLYMAHAILTCWLKASRKDNTTTPRTTNSTVAQSSILPPARHLIFTASFLAFYSFTGYSPYSPSKAALRSLSDCLSQEMNLYAAANPCEPPVRVHTIFPASIQGEALEAENRIKTGLTKMLEEGDAPQAPDVIALKSIKALESGQELITTDFTTSLVKRSMLGGSIRGGPLRAVGDWFLASLVAILMVFVRRDMDQKVKDWGRKFGTSGMKEDAKEV